MNAANSAAAADMGGEGTDPGSEVGAGAGPSAAAAAAIAEGPPGRRGRGSGAVSGWSVRAAVAASDVGSSEEAVMSSFRYWGGGFLRGRYDVEVSKAS
ncbi:hypothetical protein [Streptomyces hokutonensis]|uniref:hypothetical protein n=1 Tax=Streptomyces hokutonensis TaxID=1306990 RepID=UPI0034053661